MPRQKPVAHAWRKNARHTGLASEEILRKHGGKTSEELKAAGK
ncbi:hypothetical protein OAE67_01065 [bacterium]|nr:hypothetical protein [bacterium]